MITIRFKVSKEDAVAMAACYYSTSETVRASMRWTRFTVSFSMALIGCVMLSKGASDLVLPVLLLTGAVAWLLFYPKFHDAYLIRNAQKLFSEQGFEKMLGDYSLTLDEAWIASVSRMGEGK